MKICICKDMVYAIKRGGGRGGIQRYGIELNSMSESHRHRKHMLEVYVEAGQAEECD